MRQKWGFVMNIKTELLKEYIADYINNHIEDFEMIEEIVKVFEKYKLDFGSCNDF